MTILATKAKNAINGLANERGLDLDISLRNNRVNGVNVGCSGFITNRSTGRVVYLDTEASVYGPLSDKIMYREAKHTKDYTGGTNRWAQRSDWAEEVVAFLAS